MMASLIATCGRTAAVLPILFAGWAGLTGTSAQAQSLHPMRAVVKSFSDTFAVRVFPGNPYRGRLPVEVRVYDQNFQPIKARIAPARAIIGAESKRSVLVEVPFNGASQRKIRICAEAVPMKAGNQSIRTQVCGKFLAKRLR